MSNFIIAGAAAAAIVLGASSAYALPPNLPYAIWVPQSVDQGASAPNGAFAGSDSYTGVSPSFQALAPAAMNEERAAFVAGDPAPPATRQAPMIEGRSAYTLDNPEGPLNDYYKGAGLSDDPDDCASLGCAVSNGS